jgi:alpha-beta hydrolase superfamily lysophospholipase
MRTPDSAALRADREPLTLVSASGLKIAATIETPTPAASASTVVVIVPSYARTMRQQFLIAWYLLRHGFRVVRYDNTRHVGVSDGDILDFTLESAIEDLNAVVTCVRNRLQPPEIAVVASSLGFRVALRALSDLQHVALLVGLVGVVNVRRTLEQAIGIDFVRRYNENSLERDLQHSVSGHVVNVFPFISAIVRNDLDTLASTIADLGRCSFPVVQIASEDDAWISLDEVNQALTGAGGARENRLYYLPGVRHDLSRNPAATALAMQKMIAVLTEFSPGPALKEEDVVHPAFVEIVRGYKHEAAMEQERLRSGRQPRETGC